MSGSTDRLTKLALLSKHDIVAVNKCTLKFDDVVGQSTSRPATRASFGRVTTTRRRLQLRAGSAFNLTWR